MLLKTMEDRQTPLNVPPTPPFTMMDRRWSGVIKGQTISCHVQKARARYDLHQYLETRSKALKSLCFCGLRTFKQNQKPLGPTCVKTSRLVFTCGTE